MFFSRNEIHRFFHGMGMSLNETTLDGLMARYSGSGSMDGMMAFDDFKSMMHDLQEDGHISQQVVALAVEVASIA